MELTSAAECGIMPVPAIMPVFRPDTHTGIKEGLLLEWTFFLGILGFFSLRPRRGYKKPPPVSEVGLASVGGNVVKHTLRWVN